MRADDIGELGGIGDEIDPAVLHAYLRDFLFSDARARSPVRALSGGERNRLLLARLFTRPANLLVLDEPTNDLDLETLELLEAKLLEWPGTLLLVSHDRAFLDHVVTSTIVFEGAGRLREYVGGYEDWQRQRAQSTGLSASADAERKRASKASLETGSRQAVSKRAKLSNKEQRELDDLPVRIEKLETERHALDLAIASPGFYREAPGVITTSLARREAIEGELTTLYARWEGLASRVP